MEWVERAPMHRPAFVLPRSGGLPVFVDPHGHRARRLRHGARVVAGVAAVYLALLALGLAGPAAPPFSLFPGAGARAGEGGTEAVRAGSGPAASSEQVREAVAALTATLRGEAPATAPGATGADPSAPGAVPGTTPGDATPGTRAPGSAPAANPSNPPAATSAPPGRSGSAPRSGSASPPPAAPAPGTTPSATPGHGPPAGHVPPGQAKKVSGAPSGGNGNGNGNGPPDNHGQQVAAQHSQSPNH